MRLSPSGGESLERDAVLTHRWLTCRRRSAGASARRLSIDSRLHRIFCSNLLLDLSNESFSFQKLQLQAFGHMASFQKEEKAAKL